VRRKTNDKSKSFDAKGAKFINSFAKEAVAVDAALAWGGWYGGTISWGWYEGARGNDLGILL
jgi:hypothetical protein